MKTRNRLRNLHPLLLDNPDFKCAHCHQFVSADSVLSGVGHRNHCPYCLWSRHLDLHQAGDRMAACLAPMRPVGLTAKQTRNKYRTRSGELMLVHHCEACGVFSINRVAADDEPNTILEVFKRSHSLDKRVFRQLKNRGVMLLEDCDEDTVLAQLYGTLAFA